MGKFFQYKNFNLGVKTEKMGNRAGDWGPGVSRRLWLCRRKEPKRGIRGLCRAAPGQALHPTGTRSERAPRKCPPVGVGGDASRRLLSDGPAATRRSA